MKDEPARNRRRRRSSRSISVVTSENVNSSSTNCRQKRESMKSFAVTKFILDKLWEIQKKNYLAANFERVDVKWKNGLWYASLRQGYVMLGFVKFQ